MLPTCRDPGRAGILAWPGAGPAPRQDPHAAQYFAAPRGARGAPRPQQGADGPNSQAARSRDLLHRRGASHRRPKACRRGGRAGRRRSRGACCRRRRRNREQDPVCRAHRSSVRVDASTWRGRRSPRAAADGSSSPADISCAEGGPALRPTGSVPRSATNGGGFACLRDGALGPRPASGTRSQIVAPRPGTPPADSSISLLKTTNREPLSLARGQGKWSCP